MSFEDRYAKEAGIRDFIQRQRTKGINKEFQDMAENDRKTGIEFDYMGHNALVDAHGEAADRYNQAAYECALDSPAYRHNAAMAEKHRNATHFNALAMDAAHVYRMATRDGFDPQDMTHVAAKAHYHNAKFYADSASHGAGPTNLPPMYDDDEDQYEG